MVNPRQTRIVKGVEGHSEMKGKLTKIAEGERNTICSIYILYMDTRRVEHDFGQCVDAEGQTVQWILETK